MNNRITNHSNRQQSIVTAVVFSFLSILLIAALPKSLPLLEPDSHGYIAFSAFRSAFYPTFLELLASLNVTLENIPYAQLAFYFCSLIILTYTLLQQRAPLRFVVIFLCAIVFNFYYGSYHFSILTESLTFSLQNCLIAAMLLYLRDKSPRFVIIVALLVGLLCGIKPVMLTMLPAIALILTLSNWRQWRKILHHLGLFACMVTALILLEGFIFHTQHEQRKSLAGLTLYGKMAMLTTDKHFNRPPSLTLKEDNLLKLTQQAMAPVKQWRQKQKNPFTLAVRLADYEVFAQYQLWPHIQKNHPSAYIDDTLKRSAAKKVIAHNIGAYLRLSFWHYLGLWSVYSKTFFDYFSGDAGTEPVLEIGPDFALDAHFSPLSFIVFPAFLLLAVFIMITSLLYVARLLTICFQWQKNTMNTTHMQIAALLILIQVNLCAHAFANVSTPRYFMVTYPHCILVFLMAARLLLAARRSARNQEVNLKYFEENLIQ